jgi:hypothetical protein
MTKTRASREFLVDLERTVAHRLSREGGDPRMALLDIQGRIQRELWPCPECVTERLQHPKECTRCGIGGVDPDSMGDELAELKAAGAWWSESW